MLGLFSANRRPSRAGWRSVVGPVRCLGPIAARGRSAEHSFGIECLKTSRYGAADVDWIRSSVIGSRKWSVNIDVPFPVPVLGTDCYAQLGDDFILYPRYLIDFAEICRQGSGSTPWNNEQR
jgi:hypothetical protein